MGRAKEDEDKEKEEEILSEDELINEKVKLDSSQTLVCILEKERKFKVENKLVIIYL